MKTFYNTYSYDNALFFEGIFIDIELFLSVKEPILEVTIIDTEQILDLNLLSYNEEGAKWFTLQFPDFVYYTSS